MKFLLLGATGMAGHTIALYLHERGHDVTTYSRAPFSHGGRENINGDLTDQAFLEELLTRQRYDVVINCIGVLNQACDIDPASAVYLNSYLPHAIVNVLRGSPTRLIHMSTDCVFSGKAAPYYENSYCDGETLYDRTKAIGEVTGTRHLTFRNSIIGPDLNQKGIGLFNWFMRQKGSMNGYTEAIWTGVTTLTLAKAMESAAAQYVNGLYQLVHPVSINKFDLLQLFNKHFRSSSLPILPSNTVNVDKTLINTRSDFPFSVPSYEQMIIEMKEWIWAHPDLYPHYVDEANS